MSSFTRNTRSANSARRSQALGAGIALVLASGAALADGAHRFVFTAYSDAVGGGEVLAGRYSVALEDLKLQPGNVDLDPSAANTNRCIAYSMTLQWQEARAACDAAVRAAEDQRISHSSGWTWLPADDDDRLALAYTNRAVLHWLSHEDSAARQDLARARRLSPQAEFVAQNLAALAGHSEVAQAQARSELAQAAHRPSAR